MMPAIPPFMILGSKENCFVCWLDEEMPDEEETFAEVIVEDGVEDEAGASASLDFIA